MLKRTPFHQFHVENSAKMVDFVGWEMPLLYRSIIDEHEQVRSSGGVFDVSHMGRFHLSGPGARPFLDRVCTRQIHGMTAGQARYSMVCNEQGGCRDDVLVYKLGDDDYLMVCNAANRQKLLDHFAQVRGDEEFQLDDDTLSTGMLAVQGPQVMALIGQFEPSIAELKRYRFRIKNVFGAKVMISRTGYTGEDGVEIILPATLAATGLGLLGGYMTGDNAPLKPAGLGSRDSLRLEAGMALYGHEITEELDPLSAGLNFAVKVNKGEDDPQIGRFIGQDALQQKLAEGLPRKLVGLVLEGKRTARQDMKVSHGGAEVGVVTSGCLSPTLGKSIAMAYVDAALAEPGGTVEVDLGRTTVSAEVVALPFYKAG